MKKIRDLNKNDMTSILSTYVITQEFLTYGAAKEEKWKNGTVSSQVYFMSSNEPEGRNSLQNQLAAGFS
jgi:hypothetical protein